MNWYNNRKIGAKLFIGFGTVILLLVALSVITVLLMKQLSDSDSEMYFGNTVPMVYLGVMYDTLASERICLNNMVIFRETDPAFAAEEAESLKEKEALFEEALENYRKTIGDDSVDMALYNSVYNDYYGSFVTTKTNVIDAINSGSEKRMSEAIKAMDAMGAQVSGYMDESFSHNESQGADKESQNQALYNTSRNTTIIAVIIIVLASVGTAAFISSTIRKPLGLVGSAAKQVGETGNLTFSDEFVAEVKAYAKNTDETGQLCLDFANMMDSIIERAGVITQVSVGDLTGEVALLSDSDTLGSAVQKLLLNLNSKFSEISNATVQVSTGAGQMASGAQSLAQASTEQAGTVENLSVSVSDIANKTKEDRKSVV